MLGGAEVDRMAIGVGYGGGLGRDPSAGQPYFHVVERDLGHVSLLSWCKCTPDGRQVSEVRRRAGDAEGEGPW